MLRNPNRWLAGIVAALTVLIAPSLAPAHETDQFTLPLGREFADLREHFTQWVYDTIERGVKRTNEKIRQCVSSGRNPRRLAELQSADEIVRAVNWEFPAAYNVIEGWEGDLRSSKLQSRYPGMLLGYKEQFTNIEQKTHFILDPRQIFRIWHAQTFKCNGVYLGTDKIGHFTDMGMNYYRPYSAALKKGKTKDEALADAVRVGTHGLLFSERGAVGYLSAGAYSNGDLAANYLGFKFYLNLTEPTMLKSQLRPPMLVLDGDYWKFAAQVRRDSDFCLAFIDDHFNEALNPSLFESAMRKAVRTAVKERTERILSRYLDSNGNRRPKSWFDQKVTDLTTYYGEYYGHDGTSTELVTIGNACFEPFDFKGSVTARDPLGLTALHDAADRCDLEAMKQLIQKGAEVNATIRSNESDSPDWGNTPLHYAARGGHKAAIELLLEHGADINAKNDRGATPLYRAIASAAIVDYLVKRGATVDAKDNLGRTPLHWAASEGFAESCEVLLAAGADVNLKDRYSESPLTRAVRWRHANVVQLLVTNHGDVNSLADFNTTPLHFAAATENAELIKLLLDSGANINAQDAFGWAPLHVAAQDGSEAVTAMLIDRRAKVTISDPTGVMPLHIAARRGRDELVVMLIDHGANVNAVTNLGITPMHEAVFSGNVVVVRELLEHRADADVRNQLGRTPLDVALAGNNREIVALLRNGSKSVSMSVHP